MGLVRLARQPVALGDLCRPLVNVNHAISIHTYPGDTNIDLSHGAHKTECQSPVGQVGRSTAPRGSLGARLARRLYGCSPSWEFRW